MANSKFLIGRNTNIYVAPAGLSNGDVPGNGNDNSTTALDNKWTATVDALAAKGATTITLTVGSGIPAGSTVIPANTYLNFVDANGVSVPVQVTAEADPTAAEVVSLTVAALVADVPAGATATYPTFVALRNSANIGLNGNRINFFAFEDGGHESGTNATISTSLSLGGNFAATDAGFLNIQYLYEQFCQAYFFVELSASDDRFQRGVVYQGLGTITSITTDIPSDNFITGAVEAAFDEAPLKYDQDPT